MNFPLPSVRTVELLKEPFPSGLGTGRFLTDSLEVYFVKQASEQVPPHRLVNEFLCSRLLTLWGVPTPEIATVDINSEMPAFGSRSLGSTATELSSLFTLRSQTDLKRFQNPADLFKIGLFDIWVENRNRKEARLNLLINHEHANWKIYAIDHGKVFHDQPHIHLNPAKGVQQPFRDSVLQSHLARQVKLFFAKRGIAVFTKSYFFSLINRCESQFDALLAATPEAWNWPAEDRRALRKFLFDRNRNEAVYDDFLVKLQ